MITAPASPTVTRSLDTLVSDAAALLDVYQNDPANLESWNAVARIRREIATAVAAIPTARKQGSEFAVVESLLERLMTTGAMEQAAEPEDHEMLKVFAKKGWPGWLASMVLVPAWEWTAAPSLDEVPTWFWSVYTRYQFFVPQSFTVPGQAERYAAHHLSRLTELERWTSVNRGSAAVKAALSTYILHSNCIPLYFSESSLVQHYKLRARLFSFALNVDRQMDLPPFERYGRKLRIGFINRHFGSQTETYTTIPTFEQLDKERFEVVLFAHRETGGDLENILRGKVSDFQILNGSTQDQVQSLIAANLDVAVFGTNVTAVGNEVLALALHRVAPLQVVNNSSCTTTGLPEIDLYVSGDMTECPDAPAHFTERLGLLPGPAHAFNYTLDRQEPTQVWTREALGVPADATLFVTAANFYKIIPEMQHAWAKLLAAVPGSRLLVHPFNPNWSSDYPIKRFCAEFDRVLLQYGVPEGSLIVSTSKFPTRSDVKELLRVGDIYLDTFPFGGVNSLIDPLECGVPCVVWEGSTFRSRMGAALLRAMEIPELITTDAESYHNCVVALAKDADRRNALRARIQAVMERSPVFLDSLAASESFGALVETAYDELVAVGRDAFRKNRTPIQVKVDDLAGVLVEVENSLAIGLVDQAWEGLKKVLGSAPAHPHARRLAGKALMAMGRPDRAAVYLLEAIQHIDGDTALWCELSEAFMQSGELKSALEAVQACLTLDGENVEAIVLLGMIAERVGQLDQIGEAVVVAERVAPQDPRVMDLAFKVRQAGGM